MDDLEWIQQPGPSINNLDREAVTIHLPKKCSGEEDIPPMMKLLGEQTGAGCWLRKSGKTGQKPTVSWTNSTKLQ